MQGGLVLEKTIEIAKNLAKQDGDSMIILPHVKEAIMIMEDSRRNKSRKGSIFIGGAIILGSSLITISLSIYVDYTVGVSIIENHIPVFILGALGFLLATIGLIYRK